MKILRSIIWRVILSLIILMGYMVAIKVYHSIRLSSVAAADQMLDGYFIHEDGVTMAIFVVALLLFMASWFSLILRVALTPPTNHQTAQN